MHPYGPKDAIITQAIKAQPRVATRRAICNFVPQRDAMKIDLQIPQNRLGPPEDVVIEIRNLDNVWVSPAIVQRRDGMLLATAQILSADATPMALPRQDIVVTVLSNGQGVEYRGCVGG